jgi:Leucine-rich repeat (LRR) protein
MCCFVSTFNIGAAPNMKYLDLAYNAIAEVRGLECMIHLTVLHLEANEIHSSIGIRSLCLNK